MSNDQEVSPIGQLVVWLFIIFILFGMFILTYIAGRDHGYYSARHDVRLDAIKYGYARWDVDLEGRTTFKWACEKKEAEEFPRK